MNQEQYLNTDRRLLVNLVKARRDFVESFSHWRVFFLIGLTDIVKRYARSKIGQFWLTLSFAINIAALSLVWSVLFKVKLSSYLPYFATGQLIWMYCSSTLTESCTLYILSANYLRELRLPKLCYVNALFIRNGITFLHNAPVLIPIFIAFVPFSFSGLFLAILGLILTSYFLFSLAIILSIVSLRFRDFPNIVASILQITFYFTPILWKVSFIPAHLQPYMIFNPFAVFLSISRDPLLGVPIPPNYWLAAASYGFCMSVLAFLFFSKFRSRIPYWL